MCCFTLVYVDVLFYLCVCGCVVLPLCMWMCCFTLVYVDVLFYPCVCECVVLPLCMWMCCFTLVYVDVLFYPCTGPCVVLPLCMWMCYFTFVHVLIYFLPMYTPICCFTLVNVHMLFKPCRCLVNAAKQLDEFMQLIFLYQVPLQPMPYGIINMYWAKCKQSLTQVSQLYIHVSICPKVIRSWLNLSTGGNSHVICMCVMLSWLLLIKSNHDINNHGDNSSFISISMTKCVFYLPQTMVMWLSLFTLYYETVWCKPYEIFVFFKKIFNIFCIKCWQIKMSYCYDPSAVLWEKVDNYILLWHLELYRLSWQ